MNPTAKDIGDLLWLISAWEARFPGYSTEQRMQKAVESAILERDRDALDKANKYPYLNRPIDKPDWIRGAEGRRILAEVG